MKRFIATAALVGAMLLASASLALAEQPSDNHGAEVAAVAKAADFVSGRAHGEAVSALAKTHGAEVSAAARANGEAHAAAGQARGAEHAAAGGDNADAASESGRLKAEAAAAAGLSNKP